MGTTVEVTDQHGGYVRSIKNDLTGYIHVHIFNGRTQEEHSIIVDPEDPEVIAWLKVVYNPIHLDILLGN